MVAVVLMMLVLVTFQAQTESEHPYNVLQAAGLDAR